MLKSLGYWRVKQISREQSINVRTAFKVNTLNYEKQIKPLPKF